MTSSRTLKALEPHMFSLDAMRQLPITRVKTSNKPVVVTTIERQPGAAKRAASGSPELWIPKNGADKLFWSFYYVWKGDHGYGEARKHAFRVEKETKINAVEALRAKSEDVKRYGLKLTDVECELVTAKRITYKGLCGLCIAFGVSIVYVRGRTYIDIAQGGEYTGLIITRDGATGVRKSPTGDTVPRPVDIEFLKKDLYFIQDPGKPIRAISAYSLSDLATIAEKLGVALADDGGNRKLKKRLYEDITENL